MPGQATPCSSIEVVITSTTGNRVAVKSGPRVRISPAAPEKERHPKRGASSFSAQEEIRIEDRQPPGAAGSSGSARTIPLYPPLRRICRRISSCCASSPRTPYPLLQLFCNRPRCAGLRFGFGRGCRLPAPRPRFSSFQQDYLFPLLLCVPQRRICPAKVAPYHSDQIVAMIHKPPVAGRYCPLIVYIR